MTKKQAIRAAAQHPSDRCVTCGFPAVCIVFSRTGKVGNGSLCCTDCGIEEVARLRERAGVATWDGSDYCEVLQ